MVIGDRLRELREAKMLSQGDIEKRTGLLRCYISRVEHNHTVPVVSTLEKLKVLGASEEEISETIQLAGSVGAGAIIAMADRAEHAAEAGHHWWAPVEVSV